MRAALYMRSLHRRLDSMLLLVGRRQGQFLKRQLGHVFVNHVLDVEVLRALWPKG